MIEIWKRLNQIYQVLTEEETSDRVFKRGFKQCLDLLWVGIIEHPQYNIGIELQKERAKTSQLKKKVAELEFKVNNVSEDSDYISIAAKKTIQGLRNHIKTLEKTIKGFRQEAGEIPTKKSITEAMTRLRVKNAELGQMKAYFKDKYTEEEWKVIMEDIKNRNKDITFVA